MNNPTACFRGKRCPVCHSRNLSLSAFSDPPVVRCIDCGGVGPADVLEDAPKRWEAKFCQVAVCDVCHEHKTDCCFTRDPFDEEAYGELKTKSWWCMDCYAAACNDI